MRGGRARAAGHRAAARDAGPAGRAPVRGGRRDRGGAVARGPVGRRRRAPPPPSSGLPLRLKVPIGGYDGRGQVRIVDAAELDGAWEALGPRGRDAAPRRARARLRGGGVDHRRPRRSTGRARPSRSPGTATTRGSWSNPSRRHRSPADVAERATAIGATLAAAMDLCGTLTAELFLLRDGSLVVNELAPRVHNSGHWTIEGAATSQFEQHIRAITGLGLGSTAALSPTAMVNLLGTGPRRPARLARRRGRPGRPGRPPPPLRQARRLRTPQDGPPDGPRHRHGRGARPGATRARRHSHWADDTTEDDR